MGQSVETVSIVIVSLSRRRENCPLFRCVQLLEPCRSDGVGDLDRIILRNRPLLLLECPLNREGVRVSGVQRSVSVASGGTAFPSTSSEADGLLGASFRLRCNSKDMRDLEAGTGCLGNPDPEGAVESDGRLDVEDEEACWSLWVRRASVRGRDRDDLGYEASGTAAGAGCRIVRMVGIPGPGKVLPENGEKSSEFQRRRCVRRGRSYR
jgi:hypothetical protein